MKHLRVGEFDIKLHLQQLQEVALAYFWHSLPFGVPYSHCFKLLKTRFTNKVRERFLMRTPTLQISTQFLTPLSRIVPLAGALFAGFFVVSAHAEALKVGSPAPLFTVKTHEGKEFKLSDRKDKGWTVLYFYPKAGTPGCTTQACAFRDSINVIRKEGAEVFGMSSDDVSELGKFHKEHKLSFTLLSDPKAEVISSFGVKMPVLSMAKRWTFIVDPALKVRYVNDNVDPALDAKMVAETLVKLKAASASSAK